MFLTIPSYVRLLLLVSADMARDVDIFMGFPVLPASSWSCILFTLWPNMLVFYFLVDYSNLYGVEHIETCIAKQIHVVVNNQDNRCENIKCGLCNELVLSKENGRFGLLSTFSLFNKDNPA